MVTCCNHDYFTLAGECSCETKIEKEVYVVAGTLYGYLYRASGDIHTWKSKSGASRRLRAYVNLEV